jgi:beta-lactamase superfamily II metal-dependent hydrolase
MRLFAVVLLSLALTATYSVPQIPNSLEIYVVDVEGGKATLVVSPSRESLLIDTGNIGEGAQRDADRIVAVINDAGLSHIDHLMTTHWHRDHFGAMVLVAARVPIREFIDHGTNVQPDVQVDSFLHRTYPELYRRATHTVVKPGDKISIADVDVRVVASAGETLKAALPGGGTPNPYCEEFKRQSVDKTENTQSIGVHIAFGKFRIVDLGDLTADKEFDLMCPNNPIGAVDLFMVSHHGQPRSNSEVLIHAIESRVAIMNNGTRKGGQPEVMKVIHSAPGLEDLWQLHFSQLSGQEYTVPGLFIANLVDTPQTSMPVAPMPLSHPGEALAPPPVHNGTAYWIKVSAQKSGSFAVTNGRNGFSKTYRARAN